MPGRIEHTDAPRLVSIFFLEGLSGCHFEKSITEVTWRYTHEVKCGVMRNFVVQPRFLTGKPGYSVKCEEHAIAHSRALPWIFAKRNQHVVAVYLIRPDRLTESKKQREE